jgi:acyl phosphate:glycerol-3-phosphate acyltransferase
VRVAAALVAAYLVGAIPVGYLIARMSAGADIRRHGSGNIGATNVLRTLGRLPAAFTLAGDITKGAVTVVLARALLPDSAAGVAACAVLAVVGNCWPVYLAFRGGKGVATALGAFLVLIPWATLPAALVWIVIVASFRYVSLGSMLAAVCVPLGAPLLGYPAVSAMAALTVAAIILARHRDNIARLLAGTERRLGHRASV